MATDNPVSPKVKWGAIWGGLLAVGSAAVTGAVGAIDPSLFSQLGAFGPLAASAITLGGTSLAAWLAKDAIREKGLTALKAQNVIKAVFTPGVATPTGEAPKAVSQAPVAAEDTLTFGSPSTVVPEEPAQ